MNKALPRVYWDSCTWISYINKELPETHPTVRERRFDMCRNTLKRAEDGEIEIATSAFTLAEVCKRGEHQTGDRNLSSFFEQPYILIIPVDYEIGRRAQALQQAGVAGLKPPDAVQLASSLITNIPVFHTFDGPLRKLDSTLANNAGVKLRVVRPTEEEPKPGLLEAMQDAE